MTLTDRALLFTTRLIRALRYYHRLRYSWRLAWAKSYGLDTF